VPCAAEILALYADTLHKLRAGDLDALAGRLDWVLKLRILQRAMRKRPNLGWDSPEIKLLDHLYSSLDPDEGFYWIYEQAGATERVVSPARIERFVHEPPEDTRAFTRAMLLRLAEPGQVNRMDWDSICFKLSGRSGWPIYRTLDMPDPLGFTKAQTAAWLEAAQPLDAILDRLMTMDSAGSISHDTLGSSDAAPKPKPLLLPAPHTRPHSAKGGHDDAVTPAP
jgi:proteasome accessory factor A